MLTTVALLTMTLAPAQAKDPEFKNTRYTYGILGQTRKSDKYLPGDVVCLLFDVEGLKVKDNGLVEYAMGFEISKKGQKGTIQKREPQNLEAINSLGTGRFPSFAIYPIPRDEDAPGDYTIKVTVTDRATKKSATLEKAFTVSKPALGLVALRFTAFSGDPAPPIAVAGQRLALHYSLVGFEMDKKEKTSDVSITIRILEDGKPVLTKPLTGDIKSDAKASPGVMLFNPYLIELNRTGKFKVELTAKCNLSKTTAKEELDLTVLETK
jgi:hypothetical protein